MKMLKYKTLFLGTTIVVLSLLFASCDKGRDGRDGKAYVSVTWDVVEPFYVDPGTTDIPDVFKWGKYYRAKPGVYYFYYEGEFFLNGRPAFYAWEIEYEVWTNPGYAASGPMNGQDGEDTFFTLECNPHGPWVYMEEDYKSLKAPEKEILDASDDKIIIIKESEQFSLKATYRKVEI